MVDDGNRKHLIDDTGVAVCGMPAKKQNLVRWGEADCRHCVALYARRARGFRQ